MVLDNLEKTIAANEQLSKTNITLQQNYEQMLENLRETIEAKNEAIKSKDEAIKAKDEILGQTTGGESYPIVVLKKGGFYLSVRGIYSIPNLKIDIFIIPNFLKIPKDVTREYLEGKLNQQYTKHVYNHKYTKLWAKHFPESIEVTNLKDYLDPRDENFHAFDIYFESDYKKWVQRIRILSHNGKWETVSVLVEIPTTQRTNVYQQKVIYTGVSEDFPSPYGGDEFKIIPFYNTTLWQPNQMATEIIKLNQTDGISDLDLDYF